VSLRGARECVPERDFTALDNAEELGGAAAYKPGPPATCYVRYRTERGFYSVNACAADAMVIIGGQFS
jgi:hypothetical protein